MGFLALGSRQLFGLIFVIGQDEFHCPSKLVLLVEVCLQFSFELLLVTLLASLLGVLILLRQPITKHLFAFIVFEKLQWYVGIAFDGPSSSLLLDRSWRHCIVQNGTSVRLALLLVVIFCSGCVRIYDNSVDQKDQGVAKHYEEVWKRERALVVLNQLLDLVLGHEALYFRNNRRTARIQVKIF